MKVAIWKSQRISNSISMLAGTGLVASYLTCKWVFYKPEQSAKYSTELNFEGLEM